MFQLKKIILKFVLIFIPIKSWRRKIKSILIPPSPFKESAIIHKYLDGLNGIEIGASTQNPFGLEKTGGYANVDYSINHGQNWQTSKFPTAKVNIVSLGDDLPFKDETLDYVVSSHVIEHFFDPIKTIREWLRVVKKGGYVVMIVPHKERTFDRDKDISTVDEILNRHSGKIKMTDYGYLPEEKLKGGCHTSAKTHKLLTHADKVDGWVKYKEDDHHHWCIWNTEEFLKLCKKLKLNVVKHQNIDDKVGNGFTIIIRK